MRGTRDDAAVGHSYARIVEATVDTRPDVARLAPLVLATTASQALLVVLAPTIVAVGSDLRASVGAVGQARSISSGVAIVVSIALAARIDATALSRLLAVGAASAIGGCAAVAAAPTLASFLLAHVLVGIAVACLLSGSFAGLAAFPPDRRAWAVGYVAGSGALAWIVVAPIAGVVAGSASWRAAQAVPAAVALAVLVAARAAPSARASAARPRLRALVSDPSARRWIGAELVAYGAWTALLTFIGAFFIDRLAVQEAVVGWLLACGAATYFAASIRRSGRIAGLPRRRLVAAAALAMAGLFVVELDLARSAAFAVGVFCLLGVAAGIRTPASSELALEQLPEHPGAMMAARTAATQLGYMLGAAIGGIVISGAGYEALGVVLAAGMGASAWLILRVDDPRERATPVSAS